MKRLVFIFAFLLCCSAIQVQARGIMTMCGAGTSSLTCSRATQQAPTDMVTQGTYQEMGSYAGYQYIASQYVYGGTTGTLCSVDISLIKVGSPTGNAEVLIYTDNSDVPDSGTSCGTIDVSTLSDVVFEWKTLSCNVPQTNGAKYWIVIKKTNLDTTNYIRTGVDYACTTELMMRSSDAASWTGLWTTQCAMGRLYILE